MVSEKWTQKEVDILSALETFDDQDDTIDAFIGVFGRKRTRRAIKDKLRAMRLTIEEEELESTEELSTISPSLHDIIINAYEPITPAEKGYWTEAGKEWLRGMASSISPYTGRKRVNFTYNPTTKTLVFLISDIHVGKNPQAGPHAWVQRITSLKQEIETILKTTEDDIDELVFLLVGDNLEGENIFPSQNIKLVYPAFKQLKLFVSVFVELIEAVKHWFKRVRISGVPGNHGRTAKTGHPESNWDNLVMWSLSLVFTNDDVVEVEENYDPYYTITIRDKDILLTHKGVKHTGTPAMIQKVAGWAMSKDIDAIVHGHWHTPALGYWLGIPIISNGSGCGPDDLSEDMAKEEAAAQAYFFIKEGEPINSCNFVTW